jgi:hypothetical protein
MEKESGLEWFFFERHHIFWLSWAIELGPSKALFEVCPNLPQVWIILVRFLRIVWIIVGVWMNENRKLLFIWGYNKTTLSCIISQTSKSLTLTESSMRRNMEQSEYNVTSRVIRTISCG